MVKKAKRRVVVTADEHGVVRSGGRSVRGTVRWMLVRGGQGIKKHHTNTTKKHISKVLDRWPEIFFFVPGWGTILLSLTLNLKSLLIPCFPE